MKINSWILKAQSVQRVFGSRFLLHVGNYENYLQTIRNFCRDGQTAALSHAAEALHLTQSACSMALSTLENQLGQML